MFISILLAKAKMKDQSECPLGDSWIFSKCGKCPSTGRVLNHKKRKEALPFGTTWEVLETIILNETSQTEE